MNKQKGTYSRSGRILLEAKNLRAVKFRLIKTDALLACTGQSAFD